MPEDRIPQGVRKHANKLGPGRYLDPATGRVYIDSADMDHAFEEMIDETANADAARIAEMERLRKLPRPPPEVQEQAQEHLERHAVRIAQNVEDRGWVGRATSRREHLLAVQVYKKSLGQDLDEEQLQELKDLEEALPASEPKESQRESDDGQTDPADAG